MRIFADTSAILAAADRRDDRHGAAAERYASFRTNRDQLVTHNYAVVELLAVAHRCLGREAALRLADTLLAPVEIRWMTPSLHAEALAAFRADGSTGASFVDHASFAVMRSEHLTTAFAFDADFRRAGFETVP